jgi:uncharacterized GH25 family protein
MRFRRLATATLCLLSACSALAHDFWIAPTKFHAEPGQLIGLNLRVGHLPHGEPFPRTEQLIEKFIIVGPDGSTANIAGYEGRSPAGIIRPDKPGLYIAGYRSLPSPITLEAQKFEAYLREEGLERVIAARAERGQMNAQGKELFSRAAKTLIVVGPDAPSMAGFDRELGFRLELIPEVYPIGLAPGQPLPLRLVFEGKPCPDVLVVATRGEEPDKPVSARTDSQGRASFPMSPGSWLINCVHMVALPAGLDADWESTWASLTFEIPGARPVAAMAAPAAAGPTPNPPAGPEGR